MAKLILTARPLKPGEFKGDPRPEDYQALGKFVSSCSLLEVSMHLVLRAWLDIDEQLARRLIGEPRSVDLVELLRFAYARQQLFVPSPETSALLEELYEKVRYINNTRSIVAHKPCSTDGISLMFHNSLTAKLSARRYTYICTAAQLSNLADLTLHVALCLRDCGTLTQEDQGRIHRACRAHLSSFDRSDLPTPRHYTQTLRARRSQPASSPAK